MPRGIVAGTAAAFDSGSILKPMELIKLDIGLDAGASNFPFMLPIGVRFGVVFSP